VSDINPVVMIAKIASTKPFLPIALSTFFIMIGPYF
jgi:hypothetical protein